MTVAELIDLLKTKPQNLQVAITKYSEHRLLVAEELEIESLCEPRADGWVQSQRPDMPSIEYLILPGN